jgi:hypothetical protein
MGVAAVDPSRPDRIRDGNAATGKALALESAVHDDDH